MWVARALSLVVALGFAWHKRRRRAELLAALRESEARNSHLAAMVEASDDAIMTTDAALGRITFWNRGAEAMFGWSRDEAVGRPLTLAMPPERRAEGVQRLEQLRQSGQAAHYETERLTKDGRRLDVSVSLFPVRDADGRVQSFGTIQRDITERKRALEDVMRRTAELAKAQELIRLKDHFLSTVSHELRTPLSLIIGFAELLEERYPDEEAIAGILDGSQRLAAHVDHLLEYSALAGGVLSLYKTEVDMAEVARRVADIVAERFASAGVSLELALEADLPLVTGDERRLTQVLLELVDNGRKVTPAGEAVELRLSADDGHVRVDVTDRGPGIPEAEFPHVWEAFTQLELEDASRRGGLGLGLSIVKQLVELHGGRVALVSQPGRGSTFSVLLPGHVVARL